MSFKSRGRVIYGDAGRRWYPLLLCLAALAAYGGSFSAPFVLDDRANILDNPTIRSLWPLPWYGPSGHVAAGRPVANLSFAVSHALSDLSPWGYHALNLLIHMAAMLLVYGIVRRALDLPALKERFGEHGRALAFFSALFWGLHPLNTQAVTYVTQRFESMAAMFLLGALYCALRSWQGGRVWGWRAASVLALFLSVGSKETGVAGPLMIYLFEAVLVRRSFREAAKESWPLYLAYAAPLAWLGYLAGLGGTAATIDFGRFTPFEYLITQARVIAHYLRLALFPYPLVMDYAWPAESLASAWPYALLMGGLLLASLWGLFKKSPAGLAGALFFAALALTSSVFPLMDAAFEYRMYLALVPFCVLVTLSAYQLAREKEMRVVLAGLALALAVWLMLGTIARNRVFRSEAVLWADTAKKRPENARAFLNLGFALAEEGDCARARIAYGRALELEPEAWDAWYNLGNCRMLLGQAEGAAECYLRSIGLKPDNAAAHYNLAQAYRLLGRSDERERELRLALAYAPEHRAARRDLAAMLRGKEAAERSLTAADK